MKLCTKQLAILDLCVTENPIGRVGWPLRQWEQTVIKYVQPMADEGLLNIRRLGGYPGIEITDKGREALGEQK